MLKLEKITKSFTARGIVLDNLDLVAEEGDSIAVTGPSGSGKTTLLNIISLLDRPDSGGVIFRDKPILGYSPDQSAKYRNSNIGIVFQDHLLFEHLTVRENIMMPVFAQPVTQGEYNERVDYCNFLMERTGITSIGSKYPFTISGGEAQRATLVRALINRPSILLADEPTGSLDSGNSIVLGELLKELNAEFNLTMIVATHSQALASQMKKLFRLEAGKLVN